jgi:hypothetical protein
MTPTWPYCDVTDMACRSSSDSWPVYVSRHTGDKHVTELEIAHRVNKPCDDSEHDEEQRQRTMMRVLCKRSDVNHEVAA